MLIRLRAGGYAGYAKMKRPTISMKPVPGLDRSNAIQRWHSIVNAMHFSLDRSLLFKAVERSLRTFVRSFVRSTLRRSRNVTS